MSGGGAFRDRIEALRARVDIAGVVGAAVPLRGGRNPRGRCPFHGSKSENLAVYPDRGNAHCWGCGWSGDAIRFVMDHYGLSFVQAVDQLEGEHGLAGLAAAPVHREKVARERPGGDRAMVSSAVVARFLWRTGRAQPERIRTYLRARGVPAAMLGDERLGDIRFHDAAPLSPWPVIVGRKGPVDCSAPPKGWPNAPAMVALVRRAVVDGDLRWKPVGVHVTFLAPGLDGKMVRRRSDGTLYPDRKMLGGAKGGCVLLGRYAPDLPLFVGEGIETVLSGMSIASAAAEACGLAALSLGNLEGQPLTWKGGALPLFDIRPDPERPALAFAHDGPVTGLLDADMKPLRGPVDPGSGERQGLPVVERRGGPIVRRPISSAERTTICGELFVKSWRAAGTRRVRALRPLMGRDFNDMVREMEGA